MDKQELAIINENYKSILAYETKTAQIITSKIIEKPELSAWMVLMPIVFILFIQRYQKYNESSKGFSAGYLYTKKIALETAYRIYNYEISREEASALVVEIVQKNPNAELTILNIYNQQIKEIKLLSEHYLALLATKKDSYNQMVVSHYQTEDNYLGFVNQLAETEKEVTKASTPTFKDVVEVSGIMEKVEKNLWELRFEEARKFFTQG